MGKYLYQDLASKIIACFYKVYNTLGFGFLEKVYENALLIESSRITNWRARVTTN